VSYRALLFDLFDTLVLFDRNRLPEVRVDGRTIRSTAGRLHEVFQAFAPDVALAPFVEALLWSWQEAERIRAETHREVVAAERLTFVVRRLGLSPEALGPPAMDTLLRTHMHALSEAIVFPEHHAALLADLGRRHRLAVVSNFDYTPTARLVLEREGVARLFDIIVVSDEVGWRKPLPVIFETALQRLGVLAREALFIGDRLDADVAGARAVGMTTVWINRDGATAPEGEAPPDFEIRDLGQLREIVGT
jgi:HAD superfamily hydrolase (TIGR01509 family)